MQACCGCCCRPVPPPTHTQPTITLLEPSPPPISVFSVDLIGGNSGFSFAEMIGAAKEGVDVATARVAQNAQGIAGPSSLAPGTPLTCTQVRVMIMMP